MKAAKKIIAVDIFFLTVYKSRAIFLKKGNTGDVRLMAKLVRFGVSIEEALIKKFDALIKKENCPNRSLAFRDLIRERIVRKLWLGEKQVAGALTLVYDHHKRQLLSLLADVQHDFGRIIISTSHIHLDHNNCLEIIVVKGKPGDINALYIKLKSLKGIKHTNLAAATTGSQIT